MSEQDRALAHSALNQVRAVQREIQGFKNLYAAMDRRIRELEERTSDDLLASEGISGAMVAEWQVATDGRLSILESSLSGLRYEQGLAGDQRTADILEKRLQRVEGVVFAPMEEAPEDEVEDEPTGVAILRDNPHYESAFPKHIEGTHGRGTKYRLSDGTSVQCSRKEAEKKQAALDGAQPVGEPEAAE